MNRLQTAVVLLILAVATSATAQTSHTKPEDVKLTADSDDVEFCKVLGKVGGGFRRVDKGAAAMGANVVLWTIYKALRITSSEGRCLSRLRHHQR